MKTLQEKLNEIRHQAAEKINTLDFEFVSYELSFSISYIGKIEINVDGIIFTFSVNEDLFLCDHSSSELSVVNDISEAAIAKMHAYCMEKIKENSISELKILKERINKLEKTM